MQTMHIGTPTRTSPTSESPILKMDDAHKATTFMTLMRIDMASHHFDNFFFVFFYFFMVHFL